MKKSFVFIDGSNFYFKLKDLTRKLDGKFHLLDFDFKRFSGWLSKGSKLLEVHYYVGAVRQQDNNERSKRMYADQQRLLMKLKQQGIVVTLGQLIQHPDKSYHEKGVDVRVAVEMIRFARQDRYDVAYLVSSDTDLVPAVEEVKSLGKKVQYVGGAKGQSFGLTKSADDVCLLRSEDIKQFFQKQKLPKFKA